MKTSDESIYGIINKTFSHSPDSETLSKYPDIEIIRRDENAIDKSIPHDIPADIELIPMSPDEMKLISIFKKRAPKRPFTPDHMNSSKLTKPNDYASSSSSSSAFSAHDSANHVSYLETSTITQSKMATTAQSGEQMKKFHANDSACSGSGKAGGNNTITMAYNTKLEPPVTSMSIGDARIVPLSRSVSTTRSTFTFQPQRSKSPQAEQELFPTARDQFDLGQNNLICFDHGRSRSKGFDQGQNNQNDQQQTDRSDDEHNAPRCADVVDTVVENSRFGHLSSTVNDHFYQHQASFVVVSTDDSSDYSNEPLECDLLERLENNAITVTKSTIQASTMPSNASHASPSSPPLQSTRNIQHFSADQFANYMSVNSTEEIIDETSDSCVEHEILSPDNAAKSPTTDGTSETTVTMADGIYKIQNFEGVLQMQPGSMMLDQEIIEENAGHQSPQRSYSQMPIDEDGNNLIIGRSMTVCDESSNSTAALADCSGDNSADTAVEDLEPTIQNLDLDGGYAENLTDAENWVLETGEISGDSGGEQVHAIHSPDSTSNSIHIFQFNFNSNSAEANSLTMDEKLDNSEQMQAEILEAAMARARGIVSLSHRSGDCSNFKQTFNLFSAMDDTVAEDMSVEMAMMNSTESGEVNS